MSSEDVNAIIVRDASSRPEPLTPASNDEDAQSDLGSEQAKGKRKAVKPRSFVWGHFTKFEENDGSSKCKCNYCGKVLKADTKKIGTSTLKYHVNVCKEFPSNKDNSQTKLNFGKDGTVGNWKFDQNVSRKSLARMIIIDELPFSFVEFEGFRDFMAETCPMFKVPSRPTITRDIYELYINERCILKNIMRSGTQMVSITTDTWTSNQKINYMCVTAHFITSDWRLEKRIISFVPISSHKGEAIGKALERCLLDWQIENVFTITVDNASSNDVAVGYLRRKMIQRERSICQGKFLHMRCIAHIIQLVVNDGLKDMNDSVHKVRSAIRYVRQSPARLERFKECISMEKIECKKLLCLDVPTRWNSTYLMLDTALNFIPAFERFEEQDPLFKVELESGENKGVPNEIDWENLKRLVLFLKHFYDFTVRVSGSLYVTSNNFFHEISSIHCLLNKWIDEDDCLLSSMAQRMKSKYDKYWGNIEKMKSLIYISLAIDPRYKLAYVDFLLGEMYDSVKSLEMSVKVKDELTVLFDEYSRIYAPHSAQSSGIGSSSSRCGSNATDMKALMKSKFKKHRSELGVGEFKSELEKYLGEDIEEESDDFDILAWWKVNSPRFPILSRLARDVLVVPIRCF